MNVTQLKQKLAVLEAQGYGELEIVMMYWDSDWGDFTGTYPDEVCIENDEVKLY